VCDNPVPDEIPNIQVTDVDRSGQEWLAMTRELQSEWVVPNPGVPRAFGIMNIIFGVILLLFGLGSGAMLILGPTMMKQVQAQAQQSVEKAKAERAARIDELKKKEDAAKTEEEKKQLQTERQTAESVADPPDLSDLSSTWDFMSDPWYAGYAWSEIGLGILLNIAMIVAGAGLVGLTEWGRRLALWVASLKILRLTAIMIITLTVILPMTSERTKRMFDKMEAQIKTKSGGGAGAAPGFSAGMSQMTAIFGAASAVGTAVLGSIYPALALWFLTRRAARAACARQSSQGHGEKPPGAWSDDEVGGQWVSEEPGGP
jgi:hypothetical protein